MAMYCFMQIPGIKGSARQSNAKEMMKVNAVNHEVTADIGFLDGLPTGKIAHKHMVVTKDVDAGSPELYKAMRAKDPIKSVDLFFWRMPPAGGVEENHYTVTLMDATIISIRLDTSSGNPIPEQEHVTFIYKAIAWKWSGTNHDGKERSASAQADVAFAKPRELYLADIITNSGKELAKSIQTELFKAARGQLPGAPPAKAE